MNKYLEKAYAASPLWMQQLGVNAFGWYWARRRLGPVFESTWRAYEEREKWSPDHFHAFVEQRVREQVQRAYREVPFHSERFRKHGVAEADVDQFRLEDLRRFPLLEKSLVRANPAALLTQAAAQHPPAAFATSGTTGTPIRVYWDSTVHQHNIGVREARSFHWAGVSYRDPRSSIGGRLIVPKAHGRPPFWRYNPWERQLYMSAFHISAENVPDYVDALNRHKPAVMTGYASGNFFLARFIGEAGLYVHSPRAIIVGSEKLEPHMRATLERVFGTRAYEEYGSVENCALATECERGGLHIHPDFGWVEILRPDGVPAGPGESGEIVATGLANTNQLFLRYRTGDLARWGVGSCPCGRSNLPLIAELIGRQEDTVIAPDGREMVRFHGVFVELPGIVEGQVIQETLHRFVVNVVPSTAYAPEVLEQIRQRMAIRLGPEIEVEIHALPQIPREPNGKFRAVMSRLGATRRP